MLCNIDTDEAIELYRGDSLDVKCSVTWEDGSPVDLTNFNAHFQVFNTGLVKDSVDPDQITIVIPQDLGQLIIHLVPEDTTGLNVNYDYEYKANIYDQIGNVYTFKQAIFRVL